MTSDSGTTKSQPAPTTATPATTPKATPTPKAASTPAEGAAAKPEGAPPSSYSRGEGQKPVTNAYKENWNRIYGKKKRSK
jgi:hypothetical protein